MSTYEPGDSVLVRGQVLNVDTEQVLVEFFSKTDQWSGWIRADLLTSGVVIDFAAENIFVDGIVAMLRERHEKAMNGISGSTGWSRAADLIEQQTKPPRIPEPGPWGVVSVERPDGLTDYYTCGPGGWFSERGEHFNWESLPGTPTLVRPGIEEGS